jgi:hypothetical protein
MPEAFNLHSRVILVGANSKSVFQTAMSIADGQDGHLQRDTDQIHEHTPLLIPETSPNGVQTPPIQGAALQNSAPLSRLVLYFMAIHFLLAFCELILVAPFIKLFEQSLCISYYDAHDPSVIGPGDSIPEALCKIQGIQAPLATIRGWKSMFDTVPGFAKFNLGRKSLADDHSSRCCHSIREVGGSLRAEETHGDMPP